MFPKVVQFAKETFGSPKKAAAERSARIDAQRGYGTYDSLPGMKRDNSIPGFENRPRQTAERRTSQTIPGFGSQTGFNNVNTPGAGQR
jgi:hypothetical protein